MHASHLNNSPLAEAICWSSRNTLPLPHLETICSPLPLTIHCSCLCLATLKLSLILVGRSRPRNGQLCSNVLSRSTKRILLVPDRQCGRFEEVKYLSWLLVAFDSQIRPLRTPNHISCFMCCRSTFVVENALLRKPLIILPRQVIQPVCTKTDRMILVLLAKSVRTWNQGLFTVREEDASPLV